MNSNVFPSLRPLFLKVFCLLSFTVITAQAQTLKNGDFEGSSQAVVMPAGSNAKAQVEGTMGEGWRDESAWGEVSILYSLDATGGHKGAAQKMEVRSIGQGAAQFVQEMPFITGTTYHATAWVKAAAPGDMNFMIRQSGAPYQVYGSVTVHVTTEWTKIEISGVASGTDNGNGLVIFNPTAPGTFWIDDVTFDTGT